MCLKYENYFFEKHFRHSNIIHVTARSSESLIIQIKNESYEPYLGNEVQKAMHSVVSSFANPFFACLIGRASKVACPKIGAMN